MTITCVAHAPNCLFVAFGEISGKVRIVDAENGTVAYSLDHGNVVTCLDYSKNGKMLASSGRNFSIKVWCMESRRLLGEIQSDCNSAWMHWTIVTMTIIFNNLELVTASNKTCRDFTECSTHTKSSPSPVSRSQNVFQIWSIPSLDLTRVIESVSNDEIPLSMDVSPVSLDVLVVGCESGLIGLWDFNSGSRRAQCRGHVSSIHVVRFFPDGDKILSSSSDSTIRVWASGSGQQLCVFIGHTGEVRACAIFPNGRTALSCSSDMSLRLWDIANSEEISVIPVEKSFVSVSINQDASVVASCADGELYLLDVLEDSTDSWPFSMLEGCDDHENSSDSFKLQALEETGSLVSTADPNNWNERSERRNVSKHLREEGFIETKEAEDKTNELRMDEDFLDKSKDSTHLILSQKDIGKAADCDYMCPRLPLSCNTVDVSNFPPSPLETTSRKCDPDLSLANANHRQQQTSFFGEITQYTGKDVILSADLDRRQLHLRHDERRERASSIPTYDSCIGSVSKHAPINTLRDECLRSIHKCAFSDSSEFNTGVRCYKAVLQYNFGVAKEALRYEYNRLISIEIAKANKEKEELLRELDAERSNWIKKMYKAHVGRLNTFRKVRNAARGQTFEHDLILSRLNQQSLGTSDIENNSGKSMPRRDHHEDGATCAVGLGDTRRNRSKSGYCPLQNVENADSYQSVSIFSRGLQNKGIPIPTRHSRSLGLLSIGAHEDSCGVVSSQLQFAESPHSHCSVSTDGDFDYAESGQLHVPTIEKFVYLRTANDASMAMSAVDHRKLGNRTGLDDNEVETMSIPSNPCLSPRSFSAVSKEPVCPKTPTGPRLKVLFWMRHHPQFSARAVTNHRMSENPRSARRALVMEHHDSNFLEGGKMQSAGNTAAEEDSLWNQISVEHKGKCRDVSGSSLSRSSTVERPGSPGSESSDEEHTVILKRLSRLNTDWSP